MAGRLRAVFSTGWGRLAVVLWAMWIVGIGWSLQDDQDPIRFLAFAFVFPPLTAAVAWWVRLGFLSPAERQRRSDARRSNADAGAQAEPSAPSTEQHRKEEGPRGQRAYGVFTGAVVVAMLSGVFALRVADVLRQGSAALGPVGGAPVSPQPESPKVDPDVAAAFAADADACPRDQELRVLERPHGGGEVRARGCVSKDGGGNYLRQGRWAWFTKNGRKESEGTFKDDKEMGVMTSWDANGQKLAEVTLENGRREGRAISWYANGQVKSEIAYKSDKMDGLSVAWHENGQKQAEVNYTRGERQGLTTVWYANGQKESEAIYENGKQRGVVTGWYENGKKKAEATFDSGKPVPGTIRRWYSDGRIEGLESPRAAMAQPSEGAPSKGQGKIVIGSKPVAKVAVDGRDMGLWTPIPPARPLELPAGDHVITLTASDGTTTTRTVTVIANETVKITNVEDFR